MINRQILSIVLLIFAASVSQGAPKLETIFKNKKPIIAVINLRALPGQKEFVSMEKTLAGALAQVKMLEDAGVDAALFENPHGEIFQIDPAVVTAMTTITREAVKQSKKLVIGVEVLWHNPKESIAIAKASGAKFIRTDFFSDKMTADGKVVNQNPKELIEYRKKLAAENDIAIFTDIQVKYAEMIDKKITIEQSAIHAREELSDGIIVTSSKSGKPPEKEKLVNAKKGAGTLDVIIGSGFSIENAEELLPVADAVIVGTSIMTETGGDLVKEKVVALMRVVNKIRKQK